MNNPMLKLGHIVYSNCFPPHAGIISGQVPFPFKLVEGIPTELNRLLYEGKVDVSPSSSIEYAMNPGRYLLLPTLSITSKQKVMSILLESKVRIDELNNKIVAMTTASATSVVLLRILLEVRYNMNPGYTQYEQGVDDPSEQCDAMLTIGDLALTKAPRPEFPHRYDLGELWYEFTGLPFVFALWHVNYKKNIERDLDMLYDILIASKAYGISHLGDLARSEAKRFKVPEELLFSYWNSFSYGLGREEQKGLSAFYGYAAEIGVIETIPELRFWTKS
jgi:chorismate dehydratase